VDLSLTREQRAVRDAFAALFGKQATPQRVRAAEATGFDGLLWRHYAEVGALGIGVPSDCGGGDGGLLEVALVAEEAGRRLAPIPIAETAAAARVLGRLREKELLVPVLSGSVIVSLATRAGPIVGQLLVDGAIADAVLALDGDSLVYVNRPDGLAKTAYRNLGGLSLARWDAPGAATVLAEGGEARAIFGTALDHPVQLVDGLLHDRQGDDGRGEDAALVVELPGLVQPLVQGVNDRVSRLGVFAETFFYEAGQCRVHHRFVDALFVEQLQPGRRFTHRGGCFDRFPQDLALRFAFGVAVVEVVLLRSRGRDLVEGGIGDVVADLSQGRDLGASVHFHVSDRAVVLRRQELGERIACLVHVVITIEDRIAQSRRH
jgi:hypothetical protein